MPRPRQSDSVRAAERVRENNAARIVAEMTADELAAHRAWLERHGQQPTPDECAICAAMVAAER